MAHSVSSSSSSSPRVGELQERIVELQERIIEVERKIGRNSNNSSLFALA